VLIRSDIGSEPHTQRRGGVPAVARLCRDLRAAVLICPDPAVTVGSERIAATCRARGETIGRSPRSVAAFGGDVHSRTVVHLG
jgi:hypothetical protein